ncbi:helix-turn-helix protein [compost metagenome]
MIEVRIGRCLLKDLLNKRKMTQQQLADLTGINKGQINEYISGKRQTMTLMTAMKISTVLNCHIEDLFAWKVIRKR